jgi:hypothetical protein
MRIGFQKLLLTTMLMLLSSQTPGQRVQEPKVLVVNGHEGQAEVIQKDGRPYVDLQSLAQIANASLSYKQDRIIFSIGGTETHHSTSEAPVTPSSPVKETELSPTFMRAGIEQVATMREWASTMAYAVQNGYHITEDWAANYREQAANDLRLASGAATSDADHNALQLLTSEFELVREWSNKLVEARKTMDTAKYAMSPDALRNEALSQKIITCGRFLAQMLGSSSYQDDPSCH